MKNSILFLFFLLIGCQYSTGYRTSKILGKYDNLDIHHFKNNTIHPGLEVVFTNALVHKFGTYGTSLIKKSPTISLQGTLQKVYALPLSQAIKNGVIQTQEYQISVSVEVQLIDKSNSKTVWKQTFHRNRTYLPPRLSLEGISFLNASYNDSVRQSVIKKIAERISNEIYFYLLKNF